MGKLTKLLLPLGLLLPYPGFGYTYNRMLTIDHTKCGAADSSNFAVLVSLSDATFKTTANGGHIHNTVTQSGGSPVVMPADLIFTSDSGGTVKVPWEVDYYDGANGVLLAWVKLPLVSHSADTLFYVFYDDATVNTQQNTGNYAVQNVWDSHYAGVWHLPGSTSLLINDSTSYGNAVVPNSSPTAAAGKIDGAVELF